MKLPGFIDSHLHVLGLGYINYNVDLSETKSIAEVLKTLSNYKNQDMIIGRGWNQENFSENRNLTKDDLNKVSVDIPIILTRVCGHVLVVNDKMLEISGINKETSQISGGEFSFSSGIFAEKALDLIYKHIPLPSKSDLRKYFIKANEILLSNGITSVASDDFCIFPINYEYIINVLNDLYKENLIQVKIIEQVNLTIENLIDFIEKGYVNKKIGKLRMGPLKILADGSLGGKTAYLNKPYKNDTTRGIKAFTDIELFELVHLADKNGMDVVIHAIGDASIDQSINALIASMKITKRIKHNHAIIHAQLANKKQITLMKNWNIGALIQPIFLNSDIPIIESRIGSRSSESYLFKSMYNHGLRVGFSTDSPIEPVNPFLNIYTAVTRKSLKFPDLKPFNIEESYDIKTALDCYTKENLPFIYEKELDTKDYIIINKDIFDIPDEDIKTVKILETYINNKLVYKNELYGGIK